MRAPLVKFFLLLVLVSLPAYAESLKQYTTKKSFSFSENGKAHKCAYIKKAYRLSFKVKKNLFTLYADKEKLLRAQAKRASSAKAKKLIREANTLKSYLRGSPGVICKNGPGGSPTPSPTATPTPLPSETIDPTHPLAKMTRALTPDDVRHLYQRAALGEVPEAAYEIANTHGVEGLVDFMMQYGSATEVEADAARFLDNNVDGSQPSDEPQIRDWGLVDWSLYLLLESPNPYHERLAFMFLHNLLATSQDVLAWHQKDLMLDHMQLLRAASVSGDYITLLKSISRDPAMLVWLDGAKNTKRAPNINYSRELFELFTLGSPDPLFPETKQYTEADVKVSGRMHAGWGLEDEEVTPGVYRTFRVLRSRNVDTDLQTLFSGTSCQTTVPFNSSTGLPRDMEVIDATFACKSPENFLAWRLAREYLNEVPDRNVTIALASELRANSFNFNKTLKTLFMSAVFFNPENRKSIAMSPLEQLVQGMRRAKMEIAKLKPNDSLQIVGSLQWNLKDAGLRLTRFPSVFGTDPLEYAQSAWQLAFHNAMSSVAWEERFRPRDGEESLWDWRELLPSAHPTSREVVVSLLPKFNLMNLSESNIQELSKILDNWVDYDGDTRVIKRVGSDPFDANEYWHVYGRLPRLWSVLVSLQYLR